MRLGRVISSLAAAAVVAGCIVAATQLSDDGSAPDPGPVAAVGVASSAPRVPAGPATSPTAPAGIAGPPTTSPPTSPMSSATASRPATGTVAAGHPAARTAGPTTAAARSTTPAPRTSTPARPAVRAPTTPAPSTSPAKRAVRGGALPLGYGTGDATRVLTVTAPSTGSTVARLQAWYKAPGGSWLRYGSAVTAHLGSDGMSSSPSESKSATPMGSFTLTQAFGRLSNPGTKLPYFQTTPADWWISQSGPLYNTHQRCSSRCAFTQGNPNEHLYYETPYYDYAVVIDYNTRNAPGGVRQGAGSAFFLHVTDGGPTAGCVSIPQSTLVTLMRWLSPSAHPRILIGRSG